VFYNSDVTPFAVERDSAISAWCEAKGVHCGGGEPGEGYTLWPAGSVLTKTTKTVPKSFSAFYRYTLKKHAPVEPPASSRPALKRIEAPPGTRATGLPGTVPLFDVPSKEEVMGKLESGDFDGYGDTRDDYSLPTTRLSTHMKFGRVSPAEVIRVSRERGVTALTRQLLWREYYYHLAHGYPGLLRSPNRHIRPDRQRVEWEPVDRKKARDWLEGRTGEPLVDQAMRELKRSGYLHNRLRMVVASYFTRDLGMDWREGERLFATRLVDYDPSQNSGGWQSIDAQLRGQEIKASTQLKKFGPVKAEKM
jgi:deoxyribodipyrimidine photo-lyase